VRIDQHALKQPPSRQQAQLLSIWRQAHIKLVKRALRPVLLLLLLLGVALLLLLIVFNVKQLHCAGVLEHGKPLSLQCDGWQVQPAPADASVNALRQHTTGSRLNISTHHLQTPAAATQQHVQMYE
jgi:hypothetical protein